MEQDDINRLNAAKTTVAYCEATAAETASNTLFAPKVAVIKGKILVVEGFIQLSGTPISGVTLNVKAIRANAIENVLPLASAVFAYAAALTPPDQDLMAQAKITKSGLEDASKEICFNEAQRIVTLANANAANILPLGITALMLTDAAAAVTLYGNVINSSRAAQISKASAGEQAEATLASIMNIDLLLHLDPMANIFRFTKNVWWKAYKASREIIDLGTTFTKLRATTNNEEGEPIKGAIVSLIQNDEIKYTKKTDAEGKVSIVKIKPGNYNIKVECKGFITQTEVDAHFPPGAEKNHPFILQSDAAPDNFKIEKFNIPGNGSLVFPFQIPNPVPVGLQIYLLAENGNAVICTTNLPASPCMGGYNLNMGVVYKGSFQDLGLDWSKTNLQVTNLGGDTLTIAAGVNQN